MAVGTSDGQYYDDEVQHEAAQVEQHLSGSSTASTMPLGASTEPVDAFKSEVATRVANTPEKPVTKVASNEIGVKTTVPRSGIEEGKILDEGEYNVNEYMIGREGADIIEGLDHHYLDDPEISLKLKQLWLKTREDYINTLKKQKDLPQGKDIESVVI